MKLRAFFLKMSIPIGRFISKIARPECDLSSTDYETLKAHLKNGDVLCSYVGWELSNYFIPGQYKHCGIYIDGLIYESTTHNTRKVLLEEFFFKKDRIGVSRKKQILTDQQILDGIAFMESNLGEPYDYGFSMDNSRAWYCSKFVRAFFIAADVKFAQDFKLISVFGEPTVRPDDFWLCSDLFDQVISFK